MNSKDNQNKTPIMYALNNKEINFEIIELLFKKGININD